MIVELLTTLKGDEIWGKGRVFDDSKEPIPPDILKEAKLNTGTVKVIEDKPPDDDNEDVPDVPIQEIKEKVIEEIINNEFICNICGREFKNEHGLKVHKLRMHKE